MKKGAATLSLTLVLLLLPLLGATLFIVTQQTRLQDKATGLKADTNLILVLTKNPTTGKISIQKALANNGYTPYLPNQKTDSETDEIEQVLNGKTTWKASIKFTDSLAIETFASEKKQINRQDKIFSEPRVVISFPYQTGATIQIRHSQPKKTQVLDSLKIQSAILKKSYVVKSSNTRAPQSGLSSDGYLDLTFISDRYSDFDLFDADVSSMTNFLLAQSPWNEYRSKIRFAKIHNDQILCNSFNNAENLDCDSALIYNIASQTNYDFIVILEGIDDKIGWSYYPPIKYALMSRSQSNLPFPGLTLYHELGHGIGNLNDEYDYNKIETNPNRNIHANCDTSSACGKWSGIPGTNCYTICTYTNRYKSTSGSCIMETLWSESGYHLDPVDEPAMRGAINLFAPIPSGTPMIGDSSYVWTTNWCVPDVKTCLTSGLIKPAYSDYNSYCSNTAPLLCSGYEQSPPPPPPPPPPFGNPLTIKIKDRATGQKYPSQVSVRATFMSACPTGCNASCSDPVCQKGRVQTYSPSACNGAGCATWSDSTTGAGYQITLCTSCPETGSTNLPSNWKVSKTTCGTNASLWYPSAQNNSTCEIQVEKIQTASDKGPLTGYIWHDDETDHNARKNAESVEPSVKKASLTLTKVDSGANTLVAILDSGKNTGKENYSFGEIPTGDYKIKKPLIPAGFKFETCAGINRPVKIPTGNNYFYCKSGKQLLLKKWSPSAPKGFIAVSPGLFPITKNAVTTVDFPLLQKQANEPDEEILD